MFPSFVSRVLFAAAVLAVNVSAAPDAPAPHQAANWISNPSFEEGEDNDPVDWAYFLQHEKTTGLSDKAAARSGERGASFQGGGGLSYGRWITPYSIPLEPGAKYRVSFWYRGKGGEVYLAGRPAQLSSSGNLTVNLNKKFKISVAKPANATDWTYVEKEISAPGYPAWAQLCLSGNGRDACAFDDIYFERAGLTLLEPRVPQIVPEGTEITLKLNAPELRNAPADSVTWKTGPGATLKSAAKNDADGTWTLKVAADAGGDLQLEASAPTAGKPLKLAIPKFLRVYPAGAEKLFSFAAITDAHFYQLGENERNAKFAHAVSSLNALNPLFVIALGDQMEIHNGLRDEENKWICEAVKEQLGLLSVPVLTLAGNHEIDRTYEGVGTRWYHEKYLGQPRYWSFRVGKTLFAGVDVSTPGVSTREHGASFLDPAQDAWLERELAGPHEVPPVVAAHISPFNEWTDLPDRNRFLSLILGNKVGVLLTGHRHYTLDVSVANGVTAPPWPEPVTLNSPAEAAASIADPGRSTFLTTTSVCAFALGDKKMLGYRYLLMKNGKVAWQDVLPLSLAVERAEPAAGTVKFTVKNGAEKPITGLPLLAKLPAGKITATVDGQPATAETQPLGTAGQTACVQVDVPLNATREIVLSSAP